MIQENKKPRNWGWLVLFASTGTLLCCALPIILVSLGMGAVVASMASNLPFLIKLSMYKEWMFAGSGCSYFFRLGRFIVQIEAVQQTLS